MTEETYLILLPFASTPKGREDQRKEMKIVHAAMNDAKLKPFIGEGIVTLQDKKNVTPNEVAQVLESTIVIVDGNRYEMTEFFGLSPFLYYFLGVRHAMGNQTIIVTKTDNHLPASFQQHHTLIYEQESDFERLEEFKKRLHDAAQAIVNQKDNKKPDNPIQMHISQAMIQAKQDRFDTITAEQQAKLDQLQKRLDEYQEALKRQQAVSSQRPSTGPQRIQFRPVGKKE